MRPPAPAFFGSCVGTVAGSFGTPSDADFLSSVGAPRLKERLRRRPPELVPFFSSGATSPAAAEGDAEAARPSPPVAFATLSDVDFLSAPGSAEAALLNERLRRRPPELPPFFSSGGASPAAVGGAPPSPPVALLNDMLRLRPLELPPFFSSGAFSPSPPPEPAAAASRLFLLLKLSARLALLPKLILRFISSSGSPSADGREPLSFVCRSSSCAARLSHC
mmetsp:Transcript_21354/g.50650  ORF Transcript_21354/g.50650 Transcript_21354/m.50650 type:complete len:221 (-) Transcript_21354:2714-3376(-)